jgi:hypothetical protein
MENLYDYLFWYNYNEGLWYAIQRDTLISFFGGKREKSSYIKSKEHSTLVEIIVNSRILEELERE